MGIGTSLRAMLVFAGGTFPFHALLAAEVFRCTGPDDQPIFQQQPCEQSHNAITISPPPHQRDGQRDDQRAHQSDRQNNTTTPVTAVASTKQCDRLAEAVRQIGRGYHAGETELALRQQLTGLYEPAQLEHAFSAFQFGRSVQSEDLALFSQLACETTADLPSPQAWYLNKNAISIRLQGWQQAWKWSSSWRIVGIREQPGFQIELAYADFDSAHVRVGCRAHDSGRRLEGMGHQLLALWAERVQPGASQHRHSANSHPVNFGNSHGRDPETKRELLTASLPPQVDTRLTAMDISSTPLVAVALAPERICLAVRTGEVTGFNVERQATNLFEQLLTNARSPAN